MIAIACVDENWGIGKCGELLFHIKKDMESFKRLTENGIVIMGRRTWESLPKKPLPNRINVIVTSDDSCISTENTYFTRIEDVMNLVGRLQKETGIGEFKTFLIGGEKLYNTLLNKCSVALITKVHSVDINADTFFPNLDKSSYWVTRLHSDDSMVDEDTGLEFDFLRYYNTYCE